MVLQALTFDLLLLGPDERAYCDTVARLAQMSDYIEWPNFSTADRWIWESVTDEENPHADSSRSIDTLFVPSLNRRTLDQPSRRAIGGPIRAAIAKGSRFQASISNSNFGLDGFSSGGLDPLTM